MSHRRCGGAQSVGLQLGRKGNEVSTANSELRLSRTRLGRAAYSAAAVALGITALAACGSSKSSTSATTAVSGGSSTTTGSAPSVTITGPGVTATQIKIGQIATVSGPVPGLFKNAADSMDAFVAYVNSQGGIDGRQLVVVHKDDAYDCVTYTNAL